MRTLALPHTISPVHVLAFRQSYYANDENNLKRYWKYLLLVGEDLSVPLN